jgi:hypothetical protein
MSGCYRCGLPEGSETRLCDTCRSYRLPCAPLMDIVDPECVPTGVELTPRMQRYILSGGALLYLGIVGLGIVIQSARIEQRDFNPKGDFVTSGGVADPVSHDTEFGFVAGPRGELLR